MNLLPLATHPFRATPHRGTAAAVFLVVCLALAVPTGCGPKPDATTARPPLEGIAVKLVVVDDPAIAEASRRLAGEWNAQSGATLEVQEMSPAQFQSRLQGQLQGSGKPAADALILPTPQMGLAADGKLAAPLTQESLESSAGHWTDIFESLRTHGAAWGNQIVGVPLGSPMLVCYLRADLLEKLHRTPPATWAEYLDLARELAQPPHEKPGSANWHALAEPLGPGWAGLTLLARAAPYVRHRQNYSALFQIDSMEPLIAGPPLVRALEELVAAAKLGPPEQLSYDPAATRRAFWQGRCAMALSWPSGAAQLPPEEPVEKNHPLDVLFAELPGSRDVYNLSDHAWMKREDDEDQRVPLTSLTGRMGMVARETAQPAAAVQLLVWLSSAQPSFPVAAHSPATTISRQSQLQLPRPWVEKRAAAKTAARYAVLCDKMFRHAVWLPALPIAGRDDYLQALDEAVRQAIGGQATPQKALERAADRWRQITAKRGLQPQRAAYLRSLGLEP